MILRKKKRSDRSIVGSLPDSIWNALSLDEQGVLLLIDDFILGKKDARDVVKRLRERDELAALFKETHRRAAQQLNQEQ